MTIIKFFQYKKRLDLIFIIGLVLFVQGNTALKLVGVLFVIVARAKGLLNELNSSNSTNIFYLGLIIQSLLFGVILPLLTNNMFYLPVACAGALLWLLCLVFHGQIRLFLKNDSLTIAHSIEAIFYVNIIFSVVQISMSMLRYGVLVITSNSFGDIVAGIFANSSVNMIVNSFFLMYFFKLKKYKLAILSVLILLSTTYMSGIVIFIAALAFVIFFSNEYKLKARLTVIFAGAAMFFVFLVISPSNINYAKNNINNVLSDSPPRKILSFQQTVGHFVNNPMKVTLGEGVASFSSRVAFTVAGEYVGWYPSDWTYRSPAFSKNHFALWNDEVLSAPYSDGTANQPFSIYNQILGEYGLFGLMLFFLLYLGKYLRNYKSLTYGKVVLISALGYFMLDYWFEYFSVIVFFEIFMEMDRLSIHTKSNNDVSYVRK